MDLVDVIDEKGFVGQEFLTWLWYKSDERGGSIRLFESGADVQISFEKHMVLEYGEGETLEKVICKGLQAELQEARTGLAMGKKLEQARVRMSRDDYEWRMTLGATLFEFRSVKLPRTPSESEDGDEIAAFEGRALDRIGLIDMAVKTVDELFRMFLMLRTGGEWEQELARLRQWIHCATQN